MKSLLLLIYFLFISHAEASDTELHLGRFSSNDLSGWKEQTIGLLKPKTSYSLIKDCDRSILISHSTKSASGQINAVKLDPKEYSTLKWSWKIDHTIKKGDEKIKDGDDFAVRIYVLFPRGFFSKTRAICYVWANKLHKGEHVTSPFSANIITVAVDSGEELAGQWTFHQRNIYEDYKSFFGEEPPRIGGVALMTDTDNTGETAVGYYGDISFIRSPKVINSKQKEHKAKETPQKEPKQKDQIPKEIKNNGESSRPTSEHPQLEKTKDELNHRELNNREKPVGTENPPPTAAPQPLLQQ